MRSRGRLDRSARAAGGVVILAFVLAASTAGAEPVVGAEIQLGASSRGESPIVLTLDEAARLLRVEPTDLEKLARQQRVPGRRIGDSWRFSREALLAWLAGTGPWDSADLSQPPEAGGEDPAAERPMSEAELEATLGRGPEADGVEPATAGEPPESKTAEQIFLRRKQLLLDRGQFIVEPWLAYSRGEEDAIRGYELQFEGVGSLTVPQMFREKQETTTAALGFRYGLFDRTEIYAAARYRYRHLSERSHHRDASVPALIGKPEEDSHLGRIYLGARRTLFDEGRNLPGIVLSTEVGIPISKTSFSLGTGMWLVRSFDPISIFAGMEYRHTFSKDFDDLSLLEPEDLFSFSVGYSFAVNDRLSLSTSVQALFTDETEFDSDITMKSDQSYGLRLAVTHMLRKGMYVEPHLILGLNDPGSWMMLGLSVPLTFDSSWGVSESR